MSYEGKQHTVKKKNTMSNTLVRLVKTTYRCQQIKLFKKYELKCQLPWKFYKAFIIYIELWQNVIEITSLSHSPPFDNLYKLQCVITKPFNLFQCKTDNVYNHSFIITSPKFAFLHFYSLIGTDTGSATCDQLDVMQTDILGHDGGRALQWGWGRISSNNGSLHNFHIMVALFILSPSTSK